MLADFSPTSLCCLLGLIMRPFQQDYALGAVLHDGLSAFLPKRSGCFQEYVLVILALIFSSL